MKSIITKLALFACLTFSQLMALNVLAEGPGGGNGGDAVLLPSGKWNLLDLAEPKIYDIFFPDTQAAADIVHTFLFQYNKCSGDFTLQIWSVLGKSYEDYFLIGRDHPYKELVWAKTYTPLEEINDEGDIRYFDYVTKKQLAVQKKNGIVVVYYPLFESLEKNNKKALNAFFVHEAVERVVNINLPEYISKNGTTKIRELVRWTFDENVHKLPSALFDPLCGANGELVR